MPCCPPKALNAFRFPRPPPGVACCTAGAGAGAAPPNALNPNGSFAAAAGVPAAGVPADAMPTRSSANGSISAAGAGSAGSSRKESSFSEPDVLPRSGALTSSPGASPTRFASLTPPPTSTSTSPTSGAVAAATATGSADSPAVVSNALTCTLANTSPPNAGTIRWSSATSSQMCPLWKFFLNRKKKSPLRGKASLISPSVMPPWLRGLTTKAFGCAGSSPCSGM
mmetsp:Transcript_25055/g.78555  ORF Transcript_25055/g.78555 Transcript_25055/m.78555 type:complete len:225 (+) Transcript_25055:346-1020(+)